MLPVKRFTDFIQQNDLFGSNDKILAAVSGGIDSVIMVHLLKSAGFNFGIAHCNFQLRDAESDRDQQFCSALAGKLDVPFHTTRFDTLQHAARHKISTQMAARDLRYQWFETLRQQSDYEVIALAHHQNDAIETILLNLTRGTGIAGMHGILPKSFRLVRPMLFLNRGEIGKLADDNQVEYVEDGSNTSVKYARNKIRLEVVPKLKELNPSLESTFERNLQHFRDMELLLNQRVAELRKQLFVIDGDEIVIPLQGLKELEPKRLLIFNLLQDYGFNETTVDDLISAMGKHSGRVFGSAGYKLVLDREKIILTKNNTVVTDALKINENDTEVNFGSYKFVILNDDSPLIIKDNPMATAVDNAKLIYPLLLRTWKKGDFFYPLGMKTRKKISDFFIGQKVPVHKKEKVAILENGNGEVVWVGGYRPDERYKVTANTKKVTIFELFTGPLI